MTGQQKHEVPADRVLSVEEGAALKQEVQGLAEATRWRWQGNYASPVDAAEIANRPPAQTAGEAIFAVNGNVTAVWLFF
ncbi:hypothetical protein SAMN05216532_2941 [Streptomyces sp. 2231.1]|uniref:hypothetical protein n=1 Tax=Streptomyces sp. 2231.1 TaxID=1855347 RepID=UPI000897F800|nr:hypothetical protein [Streptomyces sp. 2231.1]SEC96168.1 hypothetical protein SAMN05216532_2941 [Streptomyces sp. 2231.1]